jgi:flagellar capping protein FliD
MVSGTTGRSSFGFCNRSNFLIAKRTYANFSHGLHKGNELPPGLILIRKRVSDYVEGNSPKFGAGHYVTALAVIISVGYASSRAIDNHMSETIQRSDEKIDRVYKKTGEKLDRLEKSLSDLKTDCRDLKTDIRDFRREVKENFSELRAEIRSLKRQSVYHCPNPPTDGATNRFS